MSCDISSSAILLTHAASCNRHCPSAAVSAAALVAATGASTAAADDRAGAVDDGAGAGVASGADMQKKHEGERQA